LLYTGVWRAQNSVNLVALWREGPRATQLVITGEEDPYYPEVKRTVKELGLNIMCLSAWFPKKLVALYQTATAYAFPFV
jgi:hypothetical protein